MTMQMLGMAVLALAVVALLIWRQLRWTRFDAARALRLPLVLGALGLVEVTTSTKTRALTAVDLTLLAAELAVALAVGAGMGRLTVFRLSPTAPGRWQTRTGWLGAALWLVLIVVRVGISAAGPALGAHIAAASGLSLVLLAATRGTTALIARTRAPQAALLSA
ncbi:hypothetical protein [Amnibacterium kyonggiense]